MNSELKDALEMLEREKEISRETILEAISNSMLAACKNSFMSTENIRVEVDSDTCEFHVYATKYVLGEGEVVRDDEVEISLEDARAIKPDAQMDDEIDIELDPMKYSRIAMSSAKSLITQKIREEERNVIYNQFAAYSRKIITGTVQRKVSRGWNINLGKTDALLKDAETVPSERLKQGSRIKVYVLEVISTPKGARINVSRTHPELVRCLFEEEVTEISDGTVEIMAIAREPGSRTKMAVVSHNPNVDPVGACVGVNGSRVNVVVNELYGEKIDIINYDENPGELIKNALSPAKITNVFADPVGKTAKVVVPDTQLSLAIGKEGQNARLAAKLTNYKIDIKSETQAQDAYGFRIEDYMVGEDEYEEEYYGEQLYDEDGNPIYDEDGNPVYAEPAYAEGEYAEGEYAEGDYVGTTYLEGDAADDAYAETAYPEGDAAEGAAPAAEPVAASEDSAPTDAE